MGALGRGVPLPHTERACGKDLPSWAEGLWERSSVSVGGGGGLREVSLPWAEGTVGKFLPS